MCRVAMDNEKIFCVCVDNVNVMFSVFLKCVKKQGEKTAARKSTKEMISVFLESFCSPTHVRI